MNSKQNLSHDWFIHVYDEDKRLYVSRAKLNPSGAFSPCNMSPDDVDYEMSKGKSKKILEISPDVVHLHNLHSNYIHLPTLFGFLAEHNIPTLITLHDCWFLSGYCSHYRYQNDCPNWKSQCENLCESPDGKNIQRRGRTG